METLMIIELLFFILQRVVRFSLKKDYKVLNPVNVYIFIWGILIFFHYMYFGNDCFGTYLYILLGSISFVVGFCLFCRKKIKIGNRAIKSKTLNEKGLEKIIRVLLIMEVIRILYFIVVMYQLAGSISVYIHQATYVRILYLTRDFSLIESLFTMFITLNCMIGLGLVGIYGAKKFHNGKYYLISWLALEFLATIITMSKLGFILSLVVLFVAYLNNLDEVSTQRDVLAKLSVPAGGSIAILLLIIGKQRNYGQYGRSLFEVVMEQAIFYVTSPIEALGIYIERFKGEIELGRNTFSFIVRILTRLGVFSNASIFSHGDVVSTIHGDTNVYTWFLPFFLDYSVIGIVLVPFFIGIISGAIYKMAQYDISANVLNSWLTGIISISFYAFLLGQTTYVIVFFYAIIFSFFFRKKIYKYNCSSIFIERMENI